MRGMDELVAWLRAQLDEDERVIAEAAEGYFYGDGHGRAVYPWFDRWAPDQPEPMLARVRADRRILDLAAEANGMDMSVDMDRRVGTRDEADEPYLGDEIVRALAQPYAGRDGWREEWQVSSGT